MLKHLPEYIIISLIILAIISLYNPMRGDYYNNRCKRINGHRVRYTPQPPPPNLVRRLPRSVIDGGIYTLGATSEGVTYW